MKTKLKYIIPALFLASLYFTDISCKKKCNDPPSPTALLMFPFTLLNENGESVLHYNKEDTISISELGGHETSADFRISLPHLYLYLDAYQAVSWQA